MQAVACLGSYLLIFNPYFNFAKLREQRILNTFYR